MDLLKGYGSDSDEESAKAKAQRAVTASRAAAAGVGVGQLVLVKDCAPDVPLNLQHESTKLRFVDPTQKKVFYNPTTEEMWKPVMGPANPHTIKGMSVGQSQNTLTGWVEPTHVDDHMFEEQYHTFMNYGYCVDPSDSANPDKLVGDANAIAANNGLTNSLIKPKHLRKQKRKLEEAAAATEGEKKDEEKKEGAEGEEKTEQTDKTPEDEGSKADKRSAKRQRVRDPADLDSFMGPWAPPKGESRELPVELTDEQKEYAQQQAAKKAKNKEVEEIEETTEFHGKEERDYQGRTYIYVPPELKKQAPDKCYIPKKCIHTWNGHTGGVNAIRFFPESGHILLSASMDGTMKIWAVSGNRQCLRTIKGHAQSVRDVNFNYDGTRFVSASFDRYVKYWDTETGKCISRHTTRKMPYCAKLHPEPSHSNECLVGQSNKVAVQWDFRANEVTQTYEEHLGAVNTITFVDENRRFVTTSDDKKIFVWEYGIPVVIKHIAEPDMHSIPAVAIHPNGKFIAGQSQDNQIVVYSTLRGFKLNKKKRFLGHFNAGYAAQIDFSPNGQFIISGDGEGRVFFWDWSTGKLMKKMTAHTKVTIGAAWHPLEPSRVATCSWDGQIKYWD